MSSIDELPVGTVTFLFTDIEGSTQLLKRLGGDRYGEALSDHQRDPAQATTLWQQVEQAVLAQAPFVPTNTRSNVDLIAKRVGNYQYNPQWGVLLSQLWVR